MPPHQREKEVADEIVSQMVDGYIQAKKSCLDDLYKILTQSQRIEIGKNKE